MVQIKLGPPLFVPNGQIGSFGAISQIKSLIRNRTDLFDLAFSGPAAAGIVSLILFGVGLGLSNSGLPKVWLSARLFVRGSSFIMRFSFSCSPGVQLLRVISICFLRSEESALL